MKRREASTKMTNVVHSGFMIKSPPERKVNVPFKIFQAQWKKRYFVLRKPLGSLPDQYELHYYKDDRCNTKKGSIDLERCEQIIESLDSDLFPNLLAIKTYCKNKVRTYYLAVETEKEMSTWVQCLCHVCGLKQEEQPTDIPEPKPAAAQPHLSTSSGGSVPLGGGMRPASPSNYVVPVPATTAASSLPMSTSPLAGRSATPPVVSQPVSIPARKTSESSLSSSPSYIPLDHCTTGPPQKVDRSESVDSVPGFTAPPPPQKRQPDNHENAADSDDVFVENDRNTYNYPPPPIEARIPDINDLNKVLPVARPPGSFRSGSGDSRNTSYDIPPSYSDSAPNVTARTDSLGVGGGRSVTPSECYDYPPSRVDSTTSSEGEVPPERPPRPCNIPSPYQNLLPVGKSPGEGLTDLNTIPPPPRAHVNSQQSGYDIPRSDTHRLATRSIQQPSLSTVSPARHKIPPRPRPGNQLYTNTQAWPNSGKSGEEVDGGRPPSVSGAESGTAPPLIPPPRHGSAGEVLDGWSGTSPHSIYQVPPPSSSSSSSTPSVAPVAPARPPTRAMQAPSASPRSMDSASSQSQEDGSSIFSSQRTRSFKRHHNINNSHVQSNKSHTLPMTVPYTAPRSAMTSRSREFPTSDDEEERNHFPISLLNSVPPRQEDADVDQELKYIDLDLPDANTDAPRSSHGYGHGHSHIHGHGHAHSHSNAERGKESATEYREIDFVKTQALSDTQRVKEKERKSDDHN